MAVGYKQIRAPYYGFAPVADTATAVTYDLQRSRIVLIIPDVAAGNIKAVSEILWANIIRLLGTPKANIKKVSGVSAS